MGNRSRFPAGCRERILQLRKERGLSQSDLADVLGMSQRNYSDIERGVHGMSVNDLVLISNFYGVSMDYLVGREKEPVEIDI